MKNVLIAALAAALVACGGGGGGGVDPAKVTLEYPSAADPTGSEGTAAAGAQSSIAQLTTLDSGFSSGVGDGLATLAENVVSTVEGDGGILLKRERATQAVKKALKMGAQLVGSSWDNPTCEVHTETSVTYNNCVETYTEPGYEYRFGMNGTMSWTAASRTLAWNVTVSDVETYSSPGEPTSKSSIVFKMTGAITYGASTITGGTRSDVIITETYGSERFGIGVSHVGDYALEYAVVDGTFCLNGGTFEAKRVWLERPYGTPAFLLPDVGVKFAFGPGCNQVQVARSIPPPPPGTTGTISCRWSDGTCSDLTGPVNDEVRAWGNRMCSSDGGTYANAACSTSGKIGYCFYSAEQTGMGGGYFTSRDFYPSDYIGAADECGWSGGTWNPL